MRHAFERDEAITALKQTLDQTPIYRAIHPGTDPLSAAIRCEEKPLASAEQLDVSGVEPERNRGPAVEPLEGGKCSLAGPKVWMPP